jgi:hypothetical protein
MPDRSSGGSITSSVPSQPRGTHISHPRRQPAAKQRQPKEGRKGGREGERRIAPCELSEERWLVPCNARAGAAATRRRGRAEPSGRTAPPRGGGRRRWSPPSPPPFPIERSRTTRRAGGASVLGPIPTREGFLGWNGCLGNGEIDLDLSHNLPPLSLSSGGGRREGGRELCVTALRKRIVSGA